MTDLQQELRQFEEPLNTLPPVNSLPDELLAEIFAFVQAAHRSKGERPHSWLNVVQVCRRWSQVAHSTASLWTTIEVCGRPEWLSRCLVLSRGMLVDIEICDWHDRLFNPQILLPILQPHHVRVIRSLTMIGIGWISVLSQLLKMGMCSLEKLQLRYTQWPCFFELDTIDVRSLPRLHTLSISGIEAPSASSTYKDLRVLELRKFLWQSVTFDRFLNFLQAASGLRKLTLDDCEFRSTASGKKPQKRSPVYLRKLVSLDITTSHSFRSSEILWMLRAPKATSVNIQLIGCSPYNSIFGLLPEDPATCLPLLATATVAELYVREGTCEIIATHGSRSIRLALLHLGSSLEKYLERGMADMTRIFSAAPVTRIVIAGNHDTTSLIDWALLFESSPLLEELVVAGSGQRVEEMWEGLGYAQPPGGQAVDICCPRLRSVTITGKEDIGAIDATEKLFDAMLAALTHRQERGCKLGELRLDLRHWGFPYAQCHGRYYENLSKVVDHVTYSDSDADNH